VQNGIRFTGEFWNKAVFEDWELVIENHSSMANDKFSIFNPQLPSK
jgi:hypothetical protein